MIRDLHNVIAGAILAFAVSLAWIYGPDSLDDLRWMAAGMPGLIPEAGQ